MTDAAVEQRDRAWGWVAHLRDGGTTPWLSWTGSAEPGGRFLPGAQQLELMRRINERLRTPADLGRRVLEASAPGRGRPDLELVGVEDAARFGPRPVDPAALRDSELLRVATGLIAEDLVAAGTPDPPPVRRPRRRRRRYRLAGDPWLAAPIKDALVANGRPPGGPGATVHVLGTDVATLIEHSWTTGAFAEGGPSWPDFLARLRIRDQVPRRVDLVAIADRWQRVPGPAGVDLVLDPAALPRLLGVRRPLPDPVPMAARASELARQTAAALGLLVVPPLRADLLRGVLLPRLAGLPGARVSVPDEDRDWVEWQASEMRRRLSRGGYAVVGDPDRLLPGWEDSPVSDVPSHDGVLDLAIELLLRPVGREEGLS